jgi:hypothetical protein
MKRFSSLELAIVATLALIVGAGLPLSGQETADADAQVPIKGYVNDWSHHHLIFSNPGTEEESIRNGTREQWLRTINSPRYIMQQQRRGLPVQTPASSGTSGPQRGPTAQLLGRGGEPPRLVVPLEELGEIAPFNSHRASIKRDWSMNSGAQTPQSLTVTVGSYTASGTSTFTVDVPTAEKLTGSAPVAEIATFTEGSSAPSSGTSLAIAGVTYNFSNSTISMSQSANTCGVETTSSRSTTLDNLVGAMTAGGSGNTKGTSAWECGTLSGVTANESSFSTSGGTYTIHMTAVTAGSVGFTYSLGSSGFTWSDTGSGDQVGSDGTNSATTFKYTTNSVADTSAQLAADLVTAINLNTAITGAMTVTTTGSSGILFQSYTTGDSVSTNISGITGTGSLAGTIVLSTVQPNTYPAKYSFSTTTASCSDYVVYPTGFAGANGGQASIVAYNNLYKSTCGSSTPPSVSWAYSTGGTTGLSPVLSLDGTQVAFIQSSSAGVASLVILRPKTGQGTSATDSVAPDDIYTCTSTSASCSTQAASYVSCKSGTTSCALVLEFDNVGGASPNDTNSSPYYIYPSSYSNPSNPDTIYVGDNSGYLHQFTGVFTGTPAEVTSSWPVHVSSVSSPMLTGPIYDEGASKLIFVGDASGYLHSVSPATEAVVTSSNDEVGTGGFVEAPVVDSNTEKVYVFVGYGGGGGGGYVNQYSAGTSLSSAGYGTYESLGNSGTTSTSSVMYAGTFDNTYYTGSGTTGNFYVCEGGVLFQIPLTTFGGDNGTIYTFNTPVSAASSSALCSPVTEFYNSSTSNDWLFVSVAASGSTTANGITCTGACLYNYSAPSSATTHTGSPSAAIASAGGTGGMVIDNNLSTTGESEVYYTTQSNEACNGNNTVGAGTGICAVQASQSALQ